MGFQVGILDGVLAKTKREPFGRRSLTHTSSPPSPILLKQLTITNFFLCTVKLTTKPKDTIAVVGKTVILRCSASGTPKPKISWGNQLGSLDLENDKRFRQHSNGNLQIREVSMADEGKYFCVASADDEYEEVTATLSVIGKRAIGEGCVKKRSLRYVLL